MSDILKIVIYVIIIVLLAKFLPVVLWIGVPIFLLVLAWDLRLRYMRNRTELKLRWILLEVVPPREIEKTAKAMEQFFSAIHGVTGGANLWDRYAVGKVPYSFSIEIISQEGNIHFLIRTRPRFRDLVEANIYAQYPGAEIREVSDYVGSFPDDLPDNKDYGVFGTEFIFTKEDAYPIRTYPIFEKDATTEEKRTDPIASLLELLSKLKPGEQIWIQYLIRPVFDGWKKKSEEIRNKIINRMEEKKEGLIKKEITGWKDASKSVTHQIIAGDSLEGSNSKMKEDPRWKSFMDPPTKAEQDVVYSIEQKASKIAFETIIRYLYIARKDVSRESATRKSMQGCFKHFSTQDMNGFMPNKPISSGAVDYRVEFEVTRNQYRRRKVFLNYKKRFFVQHSKTFKHFRPLIFERLPVFRWFFTKSKPMIMNVEELATIFHFPAITVKAPLTPKVESRTAEPPLGLPTQ